MVPRDALRGGMPLYKYVGNKILSTFENRVVGTELSEWHSGYRAYSVAALKDVDFTANSDDYDFDTGIILQLHDAGKRIAEIPIPTYYGDEISYVNGMRYAKDIVRDVVRYRAHKLGMGIVHPGAPAPKIAGELAEGLSTRMSAWLSGRPAGRALVVAGGQTAGLLASHLSDAGHDVTTVNLDAVDDPAAVIAADGGPAIGTGFDIIAAVDWLERSPHPKETLAVLRGALRPRGVAVLAVSNVGHWYPRAKLVSGRFGYEQQGALAENNLRFYTRATLSKLFDASRLVTHRWEGRGITTVDPKRSHGRWLARIDALGLALSPKLFASTWLVEVALPAEG
jgi:hypothetical protein